MRHSEQTWRFGMAAERENKSALAREYEVTRQTIYCIGAS